MKTLTSDQFEENYTTIESEKGSIYFCWTIPQQLEKIKQADKENKLWTLLDCDGRLYLASGFHLVNRMEYLITEEAHEGRGDIEIDW